MIIYMDTVKDADTGHGETYYNFIAGVEQCEMQN